MALTLDEARALHAEICVLDLHADTAKLMDKLGYNLAIRHERPLPSFMNTFGHVDLPRLREGGVAGQFFSFWTVPHPERGCRKSVMSQLDALGLPPSAQTGQARADLNQLRSDLALRLRAVEGAAGRVAGGNIAAIGTLVTDLENDKVLGTQITGELSHVVSVDLGLSLVETRACRQLVGVPI